MSIASVGFVALSRNMYMSSSTANLQRTRNDLIQSLTFAAGNKPNLAASVSIAGNAVIPCATISGANDCVALSGAPLANVSYPFDLYDTSTPPVKIAGAITPVYYSLDGQRCTSGPTTQCPFEALAFFTPSCPGATPVCDIAQDIVVSITVQQSASIARIPNSLLNFGKKTVNGFLNWHVTTSAISCPNNFSYDGNDVTGNPICISNTAGNCPAGSYLYDVVKSGSTVTKQCRALCPPNTKMDSFNGAGAPVCVANFSTSDCTPFGPNAYVKSVNFDSKTVNCVSPGYGSCPGGSYVYQILPDGTPQCTALPPPVLPPPPPPPPAAPNFNSCANASDVQFGNNPDGTAKCRSNRVGGAYMTWLRQLSGVTNLSLCVFGNPAIPGYSDATNLRSPALVQGNGCSCPTGFIPRTTFIFGNFASGGTGCPFYDWGNFPNTPDGQSCSSISVVCVMP